MSPGTEPQGRAAEGGRTSPAAPAILFALFAAAVVVAAAVSYRTRAADLHRQKERELATIAALKVDEIDRWRQERLADGASIAVEPALAAAAGPAGPRRRAGADVAAWFEALRGLGEYSAIGVVGADGSTRVAAGELRLEPADETIASLVRRSLAERRPLVSDVHRHSPHDPLHLTVVTPLPAARGAARAALVLRIDPARWFFRMVQSWPAPSASAEVLLVSAGTDRVLFANELRHFDGDPASLSVPLARSEDPAVRAALGTRGVVDGIDYRGERVLAAIQPVPGTAWSLVAKIDAAEALAPLADLRAWMAAGVVAFLAAAGAGVMLWWRSHSGAVERGRIHAEAERLALSRRVERLTKYARDMVFLADADQRLLDANDRAAELLGYPREQLVGMAVRELRDAATLEDFDRRTRAQLTDGSARFETRFRRRDGSSFPVEVSVHTETVEGRRYFHAIVRDFTERKAAEEALRASEAKFRAAFEFASLGIVLVDPRGVLVETNRAIRRMLGHGDDELRGVTLSGLHAPADRGTADAMLRQMRDGKVGAVELPRRLLRRDGSLAEVILRASALRDHGGAFRFALAVIEDVTEKKRLEAQLVLADRMASVGTLAAGVAHEINNPLAFILANVEFALGELRRARLDGEVLRALEDARDGGLRVREIVRDLKAFSRADGDGRDSVDPRQVLQSALGLAQNEIRHRARLEVELGAVPPVVASEHRLGQVFLNLLINAAQAVPEGRAAENRIRAVTSTAPDGDALVEISDTGPGIAPEVLPRIFDPFFTTKPVGVGTGLGLSICHGIVSGLGGEIHVDSAPGMGTTFRVRLPAGAARRDGARGAAPPTSAPGRRGRILVVDDEALVGRAVNRILSAQHDVVTRTSARGALDEVLGGTVAFDLVLCDLMMPDMTGMELHGRLRELAPALARRTVFLTGGAFTPSAREFLDRVPNARLEKPFDPEALREVVARALREPVRPIP